MGLDVYFHRVKRVSENTPLDTPDRLHNFTDEVDKDAQKELKQFIEKIIKPLREAWENAQTNDYWKWIYNERYFTFVEKLRKKIAVNYDWKIRPYTDKILDLPELEEVLKKEVEMWYEQYDAYFRKVNFIFAYFENIGKMVDQYFAIVEKEDVEDLIDRCERVLKDHDLANSLLPTQAGFFFGSTNYDDWYFYDVKDCLKQMKKYLKLFKGEGTGYVIFSWWVF